MATYRGPFMIHNSPERATQSPLQDTTVLSDIHPSLFYIYFQHSRDRT